METVSFCSVNKFVDYCSQNFKNYTSAVLYFENKDAFKNQYERLCIKPVFIQLKNDKKCYNMKHQEIIERFEGNLIVSFKENNSKKLPEDKDLLCELIVKFEKKIIEENVYYPSRIIICNNEYNIEKVRKQIIAEVEYKEENLDF